MVFLRLFCLTLFTLPLFGLESKVAFVVNNQPVLSEELHQRLQFSLLMMGSDVNDESMQKRLRPLITNRWIDELLQEEAARKAGIPVSVAGPNIEQVIENMAQNNKMKKEALENVFKQSGIPIYWLKRQIAIQMA